MSATEGETPFTDGRAPPRQQRSLEVLYWPTTEEKRFSIASSKCRGTPLSVCLHVALLRFASKARACCTSRSSAVIATATAYLPVTRPHSNDTSSKNTIFGVRRQQCARNRSHFTLYLLSD